jgi:hypothetical protein
LGIDRALFLGHLTRLNVEKFRKQASTKADAKCRSMPS